MKITSFFSFKGGVGRTALMINLGAYYAKKGYTVLLIDMDLFAPGITYSPWKGNYLFPEGQGLGISDLLAAFAKRKPGTKEVPFLPPHLLIREMNLPRQKLLRKEGRLLLIDAGSSLCEVHTWEGIGNVCGDYANGASMPTIRSLKPGQNEGPDSLAYRSLAQYIREDLSKAEIPPIDKNGELQKIDYVLIDCRTGFPELLDLNLGYLADNMVIVSGLNDQHLSGLRETFKALDQRLGVGTLPGLVTVVFSPVPAGEDKSVFDGLKKAHDVIKDSLRPTRYGTLEAPPATKVIHYTPILALSEDILVFDQPNSLYSMEVVAISQELDIGGFNIVQFDLVQQDILVKKPQDTFTLLDDIKKSEPSIYTKGYSRFLESNPLAQLPQWYWPLPDPDKRLEVLESFMPNNENIPGDREIMLNKLCGSIAFPEKEKIKIAHNYNKFTIEQINELSAILDNENHRAIAIWNNRPEARNELLTAFFKEQQEWGYLIGTSDEEVNKIFLEYPFKGKGVFSDWEKHPLYWLLLGEVYFAVYRQDVRLWESIDRAFHAAGEKGKIDVSLKILNIFTIEAVKKELREKIEARAADESKNEPRVMFGIAGSCIKEDNDRRDKGIEILNHLVDHIEAKEVTDARFCQLVGALILEHVNELVPRCEAVLRRAIELDSKYAYSWYSLGNLLKDYLKLYEEAEKAYKKAIELDPNFAAVWNALGNLFMENLGRFKEAEKAYKRAIEMDPQNAFPWNGLGNLLMTHLGRFEEAERAYEKAIKLDPKYAYPWNGLGNLLMNHLERYKEAENAYKRAIELDPKSAFPWNNLGHLLMRKLGRYKEAEEAFGKAIELDPKLIESRTGLIGLLTKHPGRYEEAEKICKKAIEVNPNNAALWNDLGNLLTQFLGRYKEAEEAFRKAIELDPKLAEPWNGLGGLLTKHLGRYKEAEKALKKAIELNPKNALLWHNLGNLLSNYVKHHDEAEKAFKIATELDPGLAATWSGLATLYQRLGKFQKAREAFNKAIEINSEDIKTLHNDAELALVENDLERAQRRLKKGYQLLKTNEAKRNHAVLELALALAKSNIKELPAILENLSDINASIKIPSTWNYTDMEPFINRLLPAAQNLFKAWIGAVKHQPHQDLETVYNNYQKS